MKITRFKTAEHLDIVNSWLSERQKPKTKPSDIPKIGFIAHQGIAPIAVMFLRKCEGNAGIIDSLCTNPGAESQDRHVAINLLLDTVIAEAQRRKINKLIAFSSDNLIIMRGKQHGFSMLDDYSIIVRSL